MCMCENEVTGTKIEMHWQAGDLVRARNCVSVPVDGSGMLLEGELQHVADGGIVMRHIDALFGRLNETELALFGIEGLGGIPDSPVAEIVREVGVDFLAEERAGKHVFGH